MTPGSRPCELDHDLYSKNIPIILMTPIIDPLVLYVKKG